MSATGKRNLGLYLPQHALQKPSKRSGARMGRRYVPRLGHTRTWSSSVREVVQAHRRLCQPERWRFEILLPNKQSDYQMPVVVNGVQGSGRCLFLKTPITWSRTHPPVEGLAAYTMESSFRCAGRGRGQAMWRYSHQRYRHPNHSTLLRFSLIALRFDAGMRKRRYWRRRKDHNRFSWTCPSAPEWLTASEAEALLHAEPAASITPQQAMRPD